MKYLLVLSLLALMGCAGAPAAGDSVEFPVREYFWRK